MKIFYALILMCGFANAQVVNIPDPNFLVSILDTGIVDTNGDGQIQNTEALAVTDLVLLPASSGETVNDMSGIEAFTNLTSLDFTNFYLIGDPNLSTLTNLTSLKCIGNYITNLDLSALTNLQHLECWENNLTILDLTGLSALTYLDCKINMLSSLDLSATPNLSYLDCGYQNLTSLDTNQLQNLQVLDCSGNEIAALDVSMMDNLQILRCSANHMGSLQVGAVSGLMWLDCSINDLVEVDVSALTSLTDLYAFSNTLAVLDVGGLNNLKNLICSFNQITSLDVGALINLKILYCGFNQITSLNVAALTNLQELNCINNSITALDVSSLINLTDLQCLSNQIPALNLLSLSLLTTLDCTDNPITSLDVSGLSSINTINCGAPVLSNINSDNVLPLKTLYVESAQPTFDFTKFPALKKVRIANSPITALDLSGLQQLNSARIINAPNLNYLNIKNGIFTTLEFTNNCPNLTYVCADDIEILSNYYYIGSGTNNNPSVQVNSYCSFTPGGGYNTVSGHIAYDVNADGCGASDPAVLLTRVTIDDGTSQGATMTGYDGNYSFFTGTGSFTVRPQTENPTWFIFSPAQATTDLPLGGGLQFVQDFCLQAVGTHPDSEIAIVQESNARPGFDAGYRITYRNKGNQILSGSIAIIFDGDHTDFVASQPAVDMLSANALTWNFTSLQPFESRTIGFTLNLNSSVEFPPLNAGDQLIFTATSENLSGDDIPDDNSFSYTQTVQNSNDPNNKICLEGAAVSPDNIGHFLHYAINFENGGTAEATNVVVRDAIDPAKFDISSLQVMSASHPVRVKITGNIAEFIFENIDLPLLALNPSGGNGNVLFKIKTLPTLQEGDTATNTANIYFDYNAPFETNEARTLFGQLSTQQFVIDDSIRVYPNPASGFITIAAKSDLMSISVFDSQGRILQTISAHKKEITIDISDKQKGIYFLKITTLEGSKVEKLVKE